MNQFSTSEKLETLAIQCSSFSLPISPLLSDESVEVLYQQKKRQTDSEITPTVANTEQAVTAEQEQRQQFYDGHEYQTLIKQHQVDIEERHINGVFTETFTPQDGVSAENCSRVLINLHGGSFSAGSRTLSRMESIPVAARGKIKVVSVDYRRAPEHCFPAATDDAFAVYHALLQDYQPQSIGLLGSSAGAILSGQLLVRLQENNLPLPGAVALLAGGAAKHTGDSLAFQSPIFNATAGLDLANTLKMAYFKDVDFNNPQVIPAMSDVFMSAFPPTLLATSTRDFRMSPVVATHAQLTRLGVDAQLHVFEGLEHCFHYNPELPETAELHAMTVRFFAKGLSSA